MSGKIFVLHIKVDSSTLETVGKHEWICRRLSQLGIMEDKVGMKGRKTNIVSPQNAYRANNLFFFIPDSSTKKAIGETCEDLK